jgi:hypothetical protein
MATARKSTKQKAAASLNDARIELVLQHYRIVRLDCQRHLPPEDARRGSYEIALEAGEISIGNIEKKKNCVVKIEFSLEMVGTKTPETNGEKEEKSFAISIGAEGIFETENKRSITKKNFNKDCLVPAYQLIQTLTMERAKNIASDFGYPYVRPALGISVKEISDAFGDLQTEERE